MQQEALPAHLGRPVVVDLCQPRQPIWFDPHEIIGLTDESEFPRGAYDEIRLAPRVHRRSRVEPPDLPRTREGNVYACPYYGQGERPENRPQEGPWTSGPHCVRRANNARCR